MKSQIWLLDPRPNRPSIVRMVEQGFELSERSNTPVMLELRIRACHVHGSFPTKPNRAPEFSRNNVIEDPSFDFARICLPPRSEEHTSELQSLMRNSYAVFRLKKKNTRHITDKTTTQTQVTPTSYN